MKVHFLGIGGIGVSALAQYYLVKGHEVSGSDLSASEVTDYLQKLGIKIDFGNSGFPIKSEATNNLPDLVVHTPAIKKESPAVKIFIDAGVKTQTYPEALGELTKQYFTIAISGSHGKSTTTSMTALALIKAGVDPTIIVGTRLKEFGNTNFRAGASKYLVIEACEHEESFLNYWPKIIVITNIEAEHLDYYKTLNNVIRGFKRFANHLPNNGVLILNKEDKNSRVIARSSQATKQSSFSIKQTEATKIKKILKVPGKHNIYNALATLVVTRELGIDDKITFKALSEFKGTWRRFETKSGFIENPPSHKATAGRRKITVISDYAHHPTEVIATLNAAREKYPKKKIWLIFQPHQYQRTFYLLKDFVNIFKKAKIDNIIITDIYDVAGREDQKIKDKISSQKLVGLIKKKNVFYCAQAEIENYIKHKIKSGDVLIIMGAGNIYKLYDKF